MSNIEYENLSVRYSRQLGYIDNNYSPVVIILYGSRTDGTDSPECDLDVLALVKKGEITRQYSKIDGINVDLYIYPMSAVGAIMQDSSFLRLHGGHIIRDYHDTGKIILDCVNRCAEKKSKHTVSEKEKLAAYILTAFTSAVDDAYSVYRRIKTLSDSLEAYFIMRDLFFYTPKRALKWLKDNFPAHYTLYKSALENISAKGNDQTLTDWLKIALNGYNV